MIQNEKIVDTKKCVFCTSEFDISDKDLEYYDKFSPIINKQKFQIPTPDLCPKCREQSRLLWRNERKFFKRKCDLTGNEIISIYSPKSVYKVFGVEEWWSDKWNAMDYGMDYDFNKSFFKQFGELFQKVPLQALISGNNQNSPYCHLSADNKNCYLISESSNNEDSYYGYWLQKSKDCVDCSFIHNCSNCYECTNSRNCFNATYLSNCIDCRDSDFLIDCIGCDNCFLCSNLHNKSYYIYNKEFSKQDYLEEIIKIKNTKTLIEEYNNLDKNSIKKFCEIINSENSIGNQITDSKNCYYTLQAHDAEDCRYCENVWRDAKYCMDSNTAGRGAEKVYYSLNCGIGVYGIIFCNQCWGDCLNVSYSSNCESCKNCFGCAGLVNKEYCILNKQYSKEEYEKLLPQIIEHMQAIGEWGKFFPSNLSPFGYNDSVAGEYYPLSKQQALKSGFNWNYYEQEFPKVDKIIPANKLPHNIKDIPNDILNRAIECEVSKKPFRIIKQELDFYRKNNLPIPKRHPDQRHLNRVANKNPRIFYNRNCDKCNIEITSVYNPKSEYKVYCEECYNGEVY